MGLENSINVSKQVVQMRLSLKNTITIGIILIFILLTISPILVYGDVQQKTTVMTSNMTTGEEQLALLRSEHFLVLTASDDVNSFHVTYSFPPEYQYQVPIFFELLSDSTGNITSYCIENDIHSPNKIINFTIGSMKKSDSITLHFNYWVLVKNHDYSDMPTHARMPHVDQLPDDTKIWLTSTNVVQSNSILIKLRARLLCGLHQDDLQILANRIATFAKYHRYLWFIVQLKLGTFRSQDALTTLFRNGECPGRSHLACALFRSQNVPARVILTTPQYSFWYQMHFMTEYYLPDYGWVLSETHKGITPYEPKNQIIMRICYPDDENTTRNDYFFKKMKGIENWFWIDNTQIHPYYKDLNEGSKCNMFNENEAFTDTTEAEYTFSLTKDIYRNYEQFVGANLTGENLAHFNNATSAQKSAIQKLQDSDIKGYIWYLIYALEEYGYIQP